MRAVMLGLARFLASPIFPAFYKLDAKICEPTGCGVVITASGDISG